MKSIITGVPLNAPEGFVPKAHPLLHNANDLSILLEALKSTFDALAELDVATEYKMHPDLIFKTTM